MSFFKNIASDKGKDTMLKESLINNLSECVKYIQYNNQFEENFHSVLGSTDSTNALCMALESMFLHGLKDTFLRKAKNVLSGDPDHKPQPNFWPLILVLSHRQSIEHISSLPQIHNEIGQCRAWLRLALNDCSLSSYLSALHKNISSIKPFYNKSAFVYDSEILEVAQKLIEGLETCIQFNLPLNSSLLNQWPEQVLVRAGVWISTMKEDPISAGIDVASTLVKENIKPTIAPVLIKTSDVPSLRKVLALTEDEALDYILSKDLNSTPYDSAYMNLKSYQETEKINDITTDYENNEENIDIEKPCSSYEPKNSTPSSFEDDFVPSSDILVTGNTLPGKAWSTDNNDELNASVTSDSSHGSSMIKTPELKSLSSLVENTNSLEDNYTSSPNLREIMKNIHKELNLNTEPSNAGNNVTINPEDPILQDLDFEVLTDSVIESFTGDELQKLMQQLGTLSRELGLDSQNYKCNDCRDSLGSTISKAKVCSYTGEYFCSNCMDTNLFIIPAKVIHNWDFKRYPVCKKAAQFLMEFQHQPLLDMKKINPRIYFGVSDMAYLQDLRIQLNFLKAYIFNCREPIIAELKKKIWPREYLYDHVHIYTVSDLPQIPNGSLNMQLEKVVNFAKTHVMNCWLCSQKGYICEVCKSPKILYPFETTTTYRCNECSSVFHDKCLNANIPCPKCKRIQGRAIGSSLAKSVH